MPAFDEEKITPSAKSQLIDYITDVGQPIAAPWSFVERRLRKLAAEMKLKNEPDAPTDDELEHFLNKARRGYPPPPRSTRP